MTTTASTDDQRAELLRRAVVLTAEIGEAALEEIFAEDVTAWSPGTSIASRDELAAELQARDEFFTDLTFEIATVDIVGDRGYAEWVATASQSEALVVDDETVVEAITAPVTTSGVTVATFDGDRIVDLRQYWDELTLLDGLGLLPEN